MLLPPLYCATIPTGSLPPPLTTVVAVVSSMEASVDTSADGSEDSSAALDCVACAELVSTGAATSFFVELLRETTSKATSTIAITTPIKTRLSFVLFGEFGLLDEAATGTRAPGVLAGMFAADELTKFERIVGAGITVSLIFGETDLALFLALFLAADFLTTLRAALFFTTLFAAAFFAGFFEAFFTTFFAGFFEAFFAVFLTATGSLLG